MMFSKPVNAHRNMSCRRGGLLLLAILLLLPIFAKGEAASAIIKSDVQYAIDFSYLKDVVPGGIGWLYQPNTSINQPVMFSENPTYYLRRQFDDRVSSNGSIFITGEKAPDFSAPVITLYGRNCLDYSMFGSLSYYREDEYYKEHPTLYLITPDGDYQLDIFAGLRVRPSAGDSWRVEATAASMADRLPYILENSFITPNPSSLPQEGDAWVLLSTEPYEKQGNRYVIYARKRPIQYQNAKIAYVNQLDMDSRQTLNRRVSVKNAGEWMLYAQNDPLWKKLTFEIQTSSRRRPFGDGGCGPTAIAMAIANLVEKEELVKLNDYASSPFGFRFCTCSVNDYWCSHKHLTYQLTTPDEFARYFPIAIANFATGNNIWGVYGRVDGYGTNMKYLEQLCEVYDLSFTQTKSIGEALSFLQNEDTIAIACTSGYNSPFTKTSHFLVLAGVDDQYLYVLDPLRRDNYLKTDLKEYLDVVTPGLVRVKLEYAAQCQFYPIYLLQRDAGGTEGTEGTIGGTSGATRP